MLSGDGVLDPRDGITLNVQRFSASNAENNSTSVPPQVRKRRTQVRGRAHAMPPPPPPPDPRAMSHFCLNSGKATPPWEQRRATAWRAGDNRRYLQERSSRREETTYRGSSRRQGRERFTLLIISSVATRCLNIPASPGHANKAIKLTSDLLFVRRANAAIRMRTMLVHHSDMQLANLPYSPTENTDWWLSTDLTLTEKSLSELSLRFLIRPCMVKPGFKAPAGLNPRPGHRIFTSGNRAGRCRWSAGFLVSLALSLRHRSILTSTTLIGSQDLVYTKKITTCLWWSIPVLEASTLFSDQWDPPEGSLTVIDRCSYLSCPTDSAAMPGGAILVSTPLLPPPSQAP
ncbi:hypothetical protein PR048_029224 [Dryococelus australis]|uniref:Uncharacterized protein n=1 Tax=Dryococelus australis TaxID=614101 RepID=A0ABQ9GFL9_9NEOP|nr:hypothetical protein PR048_029224 [Dryococelus australis]